MFLSLSDSVKEREWWWAEEREALRKGEMEGVNEGCTARWTEGESSGCANVYSSPTPAPPSPRLLLAPLTPSCLPRPPPLPLFLSLLYFLPPPPCSRSLPLLLLTPPPPSLPPARLFFFFSFPWLAFYLFDGLRLFFFVFSSVEYRCGLLSVVGVGVVVFGCSVVCCGGSGGRGGGGMWCVMFSGGGGCWFRCLLLWLIGPRRRRDVVLIV